ncbi:MAG TPA: YceI family protein, partial [Steroidobacteraceae bacterium]|nr:YceI family protein [Steroidobacteraceae bacterium]
MRFTHQRLAAVLLTAGALLAGAGRTVVAESAAHYVLDPAKSTLQFVFTQAGARNQGRFTRFPVTFNFSPTSPTAGHLEVTVEMTSVDTGDQERDDTLRGDDLFAVTKFPQAHFSATRINKTASGFEAVGKLTIRGVTHDLTVPFTFRTATENGAAVGYMEGRTSIKRLDYGVGQGDWKATDQLANDVAVAFTLRLVVH